jgi:hypothetical protein
MKNMASTCPMELGRIVDEYFAENRHRLIELAAFLDRMDRAQDGESPAHDFRIAALRQAIPMLLQPGPERVKRIQLLLSDPSDEPRTNLDRKAAYGAYSGAGRIL